MHVFTLSDMAVAVPNLSKLGLNLDESHAQSSGLREPPKESGRKGSHDPII